MSDKKSKIKITIFKPDQIDSAIGDVEKKAKTLKDKIHNLAVSILMDWQNNSAKKSISDEAAMEAAKLAADRINRLQAASPYHANAFSKWVGEMTNLHWAKETKVWYPTMSDCRMMGTQYTEARDKPFWEVSPPSEPKPFIMYLELERILNKAKKHEEKSVEGDMYDASAMQTIREVMQKLKDKGLMPTN